MKQYDVKYTDKAVAVVILNWNGRDLLAQLLPFLIKHTPAHLADLIVADNGSSDQSIELIESEFPEIKIIDLKENHGFAEGYNRALKQIEHPYSVLLNSDVEVSPNWLEPLVEKLKSSAQIAACQPKLLDYNKRIYFEYAGASGGYIDYLGYPFCRGRIFNSVEEDKAQYDQTKPIFWATGACLCIKTDKYKEVGGLDPLFFAHMEEIDLCWRLKSRGYGIYVVPQSKVYHMGGGTLSKISPRKTFLNFRNNLFLLYKNVHGFSFLTIFFMRLILDGIAGLQTLLLGNPKHCWAIVRAHFAFYQQFPSFGKQRKDNRLKTKKKNSEIKEIYQHSIVVRHFLQGKKSFSSLKDIL